MPPFGVPPPPPGGGRGRFGRFGGWGRGPWSGGPWGMYGRPGRGFFGPPISNDSPSAEVDSYSSWVAKNWANNFVNKRNITRNSGSKVTGFLMGTRLTMMGPLHRDLFVSRVNSVDSLYNDKRITLEQARYRKLNAAIKYYTYLLKLEYYRAVDFIKAMEEFAQNIGAVGENSYILEQVYEENGVDIEKMKKQAKKEEEERKKEEEQQEKGGKKR